VIKPEDIPHDLIEDWIKDNVSRSWPEFIARRLNAAIEAGIVSPPCHVIRHDDGIVRDPGYHRNPRVWPGKPPEGSPNAEHYRGQE
jgi:hypothetical protein